MDMPSNIQDLLDRLVSQRFGNRFKLNHLNGIRWYQMVVFGVPQIKNRLVSVQLQGTQRFIAQMGFKRMTPVQAITIPLLLKQRDVAVEASCICSCLWQISRCCSLENCGLLRVGPQNPIPCPRCPPQLVHFRLFPWVFQWVLARPARAPGRPWPF